MFNVNFVAFIMLCLLQADFLNFKDVNGWLLIVKSCRCANADCYVRVKDLTQISARFRSLYSTRTF